jgi:SET domain
MICPEYAVRKLRKCMYMYLGDTHRYGVGVFAARQFRAGEIVLLDDDGDYFDWVYSFRELNERGYDIEHMMQVGLDAFRLPTGSPEDFLNHSCDPNIGIRLNERGELIVALRDIAAHEELVYDFSTYSNNPYESFHCRCGAANCRGIIGNFNTLPVELQHRYRALGIIGDFVEVNLEQQEVAD